MPLSLAYQHTPSSRGAASGAGHVSRQDPGKPGIRRGGLGLTPVIEEFSHLRLTSTVKKARDDYELTPSRVPLLDLEIPEWEEQLLEVPLPESEASGPNFLDIVGQRYASALGPGGMLVKELERRRGGPRVQQYSMSLLSAISYDEVLANQLVEGGVDTSVFENFIYRLLEYVHTQQRFRNKRIVLLMDNATIHRHPLILDLVLAMKCILVYNPQYSPHLNPVERYFKRLK
jgi:DDE superfamily endonuclease